MGVKYYVFVYGTLRSGERNHRLLKEANLVESHCWTDGFLFDTGCGYPAMTAGTEKVVGELYEINKELLAMLDQLEGYYGETERNHYDRVKKHIFSGDKEYIALGYIYPSGKELKRIYENDWLAYRA